jgi:subtilisin family serine protease
LIKKQISRNIYEYILKTKEAIMKPQTPSLKRTLLQLFGLFIITNLIFASTLNGLAAPPPGEDDPYSTFDLPVEAMTVGASLIRDQTGASHDKLDTSMLALAGAANKSTSTAISLAESKNMNISNGRVQAQITVDPAHWEEAVLAIKGKGGEVTGVGFNNTMIQAWIQVNSLKATAESDAILYIHRPAELIYDEVDATSEGLGVTNGPAWHAAGFTGVGVKVGIIDGGFTGYTGLLGTDLPASVTVKNFVDGENDSQVDGTSPHGTACAEIVYDFAPGATMYLAKIDTTLDLEEAVTWLRDTHNVDVISTSFSYFNTAPGDGTGYLADLVQHARDGGILWVKSAGNYREMHWGGPWYDPDTDNIMNFTDSQNINYFGPGDGSAYLIPASTSLGIYMRWSDWTNVNQDYDLHMLRHNGSTWEIIASSTDIQNGGPGQTPTEFVSAVTSGSNAPYGFLVERISGNQSVDFEVLAPSTAHMDEFLHARSLGDIGDAPAAMTVAALDVVSPYPQENYSSEGPTNGPGGSASGGAIKPDISGFANVSTVSYGDVDKFNGTSAATPHVAGAATLALSAYPAYTPDQLQSFLEGRAIDMGPAGKDSQFGYGRLYLGDPPVLPKTWNGSVNSDWHNAANWTPSGVPTGGIDVTIPDMTNDPVISNGDAATDDLTLNAGAILDLTTRTLSVEGTLTNNGTLKQTGVVSTTGTTNFLRITNLAGTSTKYYGLDITPTVIGLTQASEKHHPLNFTDSLPDTPDKSRPVELKLDSLPARVSDSNSAAYPQIPDDPVSLVLDDGIQEGNIGVNDSSGGVAYQFIWLNRFTPNPADYPFNLNEIRIMFDNSTGTSNVNFGDDIDLVVYEDADGNPANGATWLATFNETVGSVDGTTWSVYTLSSPVTLNGPGDVLIGAINRYTESGVSAESFPAALDTTTTQMRSWVGWWNADPPDPAILPTDHTFGTIESVSGSTYTGNWLIRGYGETTTAPADTQVTVFVSGNQHCPERWFSVRRCYDINPVDPMTSTVRFYFTEGERFGYPLNQLLLFHLNGIWSQEPGPITIGGSGDAQYLEAQNIDDFSLFALDRPYNGISQVFLPLSVRNASISP